MEISSSILAVRQKGEARNRHIMPIKFWLCSCSCCKSLAFITMIYTLMPLDYQGGMGSTCLEEARESLAVGWLTWQA